MNSFYDSDTSSAYNEQRILVNFVLFFQIEKHNRSAIEHHTSHVRHQIPMTSSSPAPASSPHSHHHHALKLKLSEQEVERQRRKVRTLEHQLSELERAHGSRIQEFLQERRKEKDREATRLREAATRSDEALTAKERIYKERIMGLESQIETLRDQLSQEMKRRQLLISGNTGVCSHIFRRLARSVNGSFPLSKTRLSSLHGDLFIFAKLKKK